MQFTEAEQLIADLLAGRVAPGIAAQRIAAGMPVGHAVPGSAPADTVSAGSASAGSSTAGSSTSSTDQPPKSAALGEVTLDVDRQRRCGFPEVVFGEGKTEATLQKIFYRQLADGVEVLATRVSAEKASALVPLFPTAHYNAVARTLRVRPEGAAPVERRGRVAVITAGTSDWPVAEEAKETLDWMGVDTHLIHDVGVAGPHRLPAHLERLRGNDAVVVVAGMEGALPSVVGGYVDCPVVAVPTSVGYGANFHGLAALLSMLNSCAANVVVVNIDAGFKGGYVAGMIARGRTGAR